MSTINLMKTRLLFVLCLFAGMAATAQVNLTDKIPVDPKVKIGKLENGLTVLASVGSTAPFVGLFGTVWGVYHALVGIGLSDGVTINRIAGPVGEALIMTGLGLAVAIPAVLAYNTFVRNNRVFLSRLDAFAHDLFAFLTTGQQVALSDGKVRALRRQNGHAVQRGSE